MAAWKDTVRRVAAAPARPFVRYFNRRFEDVHGHLDNESQFVNIRLEEAVATARVLQERIATDVEVMSELTIGLERFGDRLADRIDALVETVEKLREDIERLRQRA
jgi:cell division protein FtsB